MRVIAGTHRGRLLAAPPGTSTRPITDRVKETLFNILGHRLAQPGDVPACDVLDVFAGTGGLGIEALSRGARTCVFVEHDRRALGCLRANIRTLGLSDCCTVLTDNAWTMRAPTAPASFGLIFIDPPYRDSADPLGVNDLLERLATALAPDGLIVLRQEMAASAPLPQSPMLRCTDERTIGHMRLLFFAPRPP